MAMSGVDAFVRLSATGSSTETVLPNDTVLERREWPSLLRLEDDFLRSATSFPSMLITSASAFPTEAKFKECLIEPLVVRFVGRVASAGELDSPAAILQYTSSIQVVSVVSCRVVLASCLS